jgi:hypothetical protein
MPELTLSNLKLAARDFVHNINGKPIPELLGVTDGKAVGTYVESLFHKFIGQTYDYDPGNAASGIDIPVLQVDVKVTSIKQPQSSCPFRDASQKVFGLGYHLLVFVYDKRDDRQAGGARLDFKHTLFIDQSKTADYQTTAGLSGILRRGGNKEDVVAFLEERNLPLDEIGREALAERILLTPPQMGYLTVSNALQWRLQYGRAIAASVTKTDGIEPLL